MTREELKNSIGKDFILKFNDESKKLRIPWKDWLTIDWNVIKVREEYRTNELSKIEGRFMIFLGAENQWPQYKCYINIHDYLAYIRRMCVNAGGTSAILNNDLIYIWDTNNQELIIAFEKLANNKCNLSRELAERLDPNYASILNS